jgi:putative inorganic carbon (HCO3(-)) transporter
MDLAKHIIGYLLFAAVVLVPFVFIPIGQYNDYFYAPKAYALSILVAAFLLILFQNRKMAGALIQPDAININLLVYLLLLVLSLFFALNLHLAIYGRLYRSEGFTTLLAYLLLFLAARTVSPGKGWTMGIALSSVILSIYDIAQFYGLDPFPRDFRRDGWISAFSTFGNQNFFGTYLVLVIPIVLDGYVRDRKNVFAIAYGILLYALLCTCTRAAWIGMAVAVSVYFFIEWRFSPDHRLYGRRVLSIAVITLFVIVCFNVLSSNVFLSRFLSISTDMKQMLLGGIKAQQAGSSRVFIWGKMIELVKSRPFTGYGIENLQEPFTQRFEQDMIHIFNDVFFVDKAHNEYLNIAAATGIPSLIAYLCFIGQVVFKSLKGLERKAAHIPYIAAVLGYLCQAFFSISVVSVAYIFWVFLGIICAYESKGSSC